ncbi:MAG: type III secretion inner membrane ring lipoprotein SctJ [Puniceicoccales bacterium]|jgi:type III secretion protein J|nr:type III secretion inner membrane ring lipoprotein SctJ [Puniceicoccales bacterium]
MKKNGFCKNLCLLFSLFMMLTLAGCGKVDLLSNLPEEEANEIVSLMQQHHVPVVKKPGLELAWTIVLKNSDEFSKAEKILKTNGYPRVQYNTIGQVFQKSGLVASPLEEKARFMYALSESVASTLNKIPGVLTSRVHIVLPENDPYSDADTEASAAIFLTYRVGSSLDESVREIKYLVANSVQGLDYDRVSIALFPVAAEENITTDGNFDTNVSVLGLRMASDAAAKFLTIVIILGVLLLCSIGAAAFFFLESRKNRRTNAVAKPAPNSPVVVQNDVQNISDLDEEPETTPEETTQEEK